MAATATIRVSIKLLKNRTPVVLGTSCPRQIFGSNHRSAVSFLNWLARSRAGQRCGGFARLLPSGVRSTRSTSCEGCDNPLASEPPLLGPRLHHLRKKKKLTLDELAVLSGVSRSMLSQVERGQTNPTFATLWNLTRALGVDLSELVHGQSAQQAATIAVQPIHFTPEIRTEDGGCLLRILSPAANAGGFEWYELIIQPGASLVSEPHAAGAKEHLTVLEGSLDVQSGEEISSVQRGATARYPADVRHAIHNRGEQAARALLVVAI